MAAVIIYNPGSGSRNVILPSGLEDLPGPGRVPDRTDHRTRGGVEMRHFYHFLDEYEAVLTRMSIDDATVSAFVDEMEAFWAHAGSGGEFAFGVDQTQTSNKLLDGSAPASQKVIPLASTTGLIVGVKYLIEAANGGAAREVVEIASISAGVSVTAVGNLIYSYASGDSFRSRLYFPRCIAIDQTNPTRERDSKRVDFRLKFRTFVNLVP
jgi:hypothetical protein